MRIIVGDEYGLMKCIDTEKKVVESKFGEMKKNNSILSIDSLYTNSNNIMTVLHQNNFYVLDWNAKNVLNTPELTINPTNLDKNAPAYNSMVVFRNTLETP